MYLVRKVLNIGALVATLPGDWLYRVNARIGWTDVSIP